MARPPHCNTRWFEDCNYPKCKCIEEKPFTLRDYSEFILEPMVNRQIDILYGQMQMFPSGTPPTRKQKLRWWIEDKKQRARDIWAILRGKDIHED